MPTSVTALPIQTHAKYDDLIARAKQVSPATTVVVHPCDETSLRGAADAAASGRRAARRQPCAGCMRIR
jgi:phosphate acetyltransferase